MYYSNSIESLQPNKSGEYTYGILFYNLAKREERDLQLIRRMKKSKRNNHTQKNKTLFHARHPPSRFVRSGVGITAAWSGTGTLYSICSAHEEEAEEDEDEAVRACVRLRHESTTANWVILMGSTTCRNGVTKWLCK